MRTHLFTTSPRLPSGSATLSPEAAGRAADARRTAGPPLGLPALARIASSGRERRKCRMTPPRGRRRRLTDGLNGKLAAKSTLDLPELAAGASKRTTPKLVVRRNSMSSE